MATLNDFFPSPWMKGDDFAEPVVATLKSVSPEQFEGDGGEMETKAVARFEETAKALILNKTNFQMLASITGEQDTDNWTGIQVTLRAEKVAAFGKVHNAVRVYPVS
jgi:hypothetical protein